VLHGFYCRLIPLAIFSAWSLEKWPVIMADVLMGVRSTGAMTTWPSGQSIHHASVMRSTVSQSSSRVSSRGTGW